MSADPRIRNSEGGSFDAATGRKVLVTSNGFAGEYRRSYCSVSAVPIAQDENGGMQRDFWYSVSHTLAKLESPEHVGRGGSTAYAAPPGRAQGQDLPRAGRFRPASRTRSAGRNLSTP